MKPIHLGYARGTRLAVAIALTFSAPLAYAHPHVFLDSLMTLETDGSGLVGFWLDWTFDPFFSAMVGLENDRDGNKVFNAAETEQVRVNAFDNLKNYGYFMWLTWGGKETRPARVEEFTVRFADDRLIYRFLVPYTVSVKPGAAERFQIAIYDETFYSDVRYADPPVSPTENPELTMVFRTIKDPGRIVRYSTTDGSIATNMGTKDATRYTGTYQPVVIEVELRRLSP